jgi:filamentous hemagglutinin family protein
LGGESSVVVPLDDYTQLIEGGAIRDEYLFHSFQEFGIPANYQVYFADPASISTIFSRVTGSNPSNIFGTLGVLGDANLFLLNPNGILFGPNARLDMGGSFVGSTGDRIALSDTLSFSATEPAMVPLLDVQVEAPVGLIFEGQEGGVIANAGNLEVTAGQNLTLAAGTIVSSGELSAPTGEVAVVTVAGTGSEDGQVQLTPSGELVDVASAPITAIAPPEQFLAPQWSDAVGLNVDGEQLTVGSSELPLNAGDIAVESLVTESGTLSAAGDLTLVDSELTTMHDLNLLAQDTLQVRDSSINLAAGTLLVQGSDVHLAAQITAPNGTVSITGDKLALLDSTDINVSGESSGGDVFIGTAINGQPAASRVYIAPDAAINADAVVNGDGGEVIVWSDEVTGFYGDITARGGAEQGDGGFVEVSGKEHLLFRGDVDVTAKNGTAGTLLLDPTDIIIAAGSADSASDGNNTFQGDSSGIVGSVLSAPLSKFNDTAPTTIYESELEQLSGDIDIILQATNNITIQDLDVANFRTSGLNLRRGAGRVELTADADGDGVGSVTMLDLDERIRAPGRNLKISGNNLILGNINTSPSEQSYSLEVGDAGSVTISGSGNIKIGNINTTVYSFSYEAKASNFGGNGGAVNIENLKTDGAISTGNINTSTVADADFDGTIGDALEVVSGNSGKVEITGSGNIDIGNITARSFATTYASIYNSKSGFARIETSSGLGGEVSINGKSMINVGEINSSSISETSFSDNFSGEADIVSLASGNVEITGEKEVYVDAVDSSSVALYSLQPGNMENPEILVSAGEGGEISITSKNNSISIGNSLNSFSLSDVNDLDNEFVDSQSGNSGGISLSAIKGSVRGDNDDKAKIFTFSIARSLSSGTGGDVRIISRDSISDFEILSLSSLSNSGEVNFQGLNDLEVFNTTIITTVQEELEFILPDPNSGIGSTRPVTLTLDTSNSGQSGMTAIAGDGNLIFDNFDIQADANGSEAAGSITIKSPGLITFRDSQINSNANSEGDAGQILIEAGSLNLGKGGFIFAKTSGTGSGGDITINASKQVRLGEGVQDFEPIISVEASGAGKPGSILINTPSFTLSETAQITATATDTATNLSEGGSITINANQMDLAGTVGIFAETEGVSPGGVLTLKTYESSSGEFNPNLDIQLARGSQVSASTSGSGRGGSLIVSAPESITVSGAGELAVETTGQGAAGNIRIATNALTIREGVKISADTTGQGVAGSIALDARDITLQNNVQIRTNTKGDKAAGDITITAPGTLVVDQSSIESQSTGGKDSLGGNINIEAGQVSVTNDSIITANNPEGAGGDLTITATTLQLKNGELSASTKSGTAGSVVLTVEGVVELANKSDISLSSQSGAAGDLELTAHSIQLSNSAIAAATESGQGGDVIVKASNALILDNASRLSLEATDGTAGKLDIKTGQLTVLGDSGVSVSSPEGIGGGLTVQADAIQLNRGELSASTASGKAGDINVTATGTVDLVNQSAIALKSSSGQAGNLDLSANTVRLDGSRIEASTASGLSGKLNLQFADSLLVDNESALSVEASQGGTAGDLKIIGNLGDKGFIRIAGNSKVSVGSETGRAGNLTISANRIELDEGKISAVTGKDALTTSNGAESSQISGANITLDNLNFLLLGNESLISASALQEAKGGNVTINADYLVATAPTGEKGSDIAANATEGKGGRVSIKSEGLFGIEFRELQTQFNDITAISKEGADGIVVIETLETDPTRNLSVLPEEPVETEVQQSCQVRGRPSNVALFDVGRGGAPRSPEDILGTVAISETWTPLPEATSADMSSESLDRNGGTSSATTVEADVVDNQPPAAPMLIFNCTDTSASR